MLNPIHWIWTRYLEGITVKQNFGLFNYNSADDRYLSSKLPLFAMLFAVIQAAICGFL